MRAPNGTEADKVIFDADNSLGRHCRLSRYLLPDLALGTSGHRQIARGMRAVNAIDAIMASYKAGDYAGALQNAQLLKQDRANAQEYYYFSGAMLHPMGRLPEAEDFLRKAIPLQKEPRLKALAANTLGLVLLDQGRYEEAIASHEESLHLWPDRGSSYRAIAEALSPDKQELAQALQNARRAAEIDRAASGLEPRVLNCKVGEDLATLAWAVAANSGTTREVESLLTEAFPLCADQAKAVQAQVHYHAGQAYSLLHERENSTQHFRDAAQIDPNEQFGRMSRDALTQ